MKIKLHTILSSVLAVGVVATGIVGYSLGYNAKHPPKEILVHASYMIDINNPAIVAGFADFVFVGRVLAIPQVEYIDQSVNRDGSDCPPYTVFNVSVVENIKGNLTLNNTVPCLQKGGPLRDSEGMLVYKGEFTPKVDDLCVFFTSIRDDGRLYGTVIKKLDETTITPAKTANKSPAAIAKLEDAELAKIEALPLYKEIVQACKNEIPYERERMTVPAEWLEDSVN